MEYFLLAFRNSLGHALTFFVNISDFDLECEKKSEIDIKKHID
jgi:hypothetical protein